MSAKKDKVPFPYGGHENWVLPPQVPTATAAAQQKESCPWLDPIVIQRDIVESPLPIGGGLGFLLSDMW
jgi:hypothetical protein